MCTHTETHGAALQHVTLTNSLCRSTLNMTSPRALPIQCFFICYYYYIIYIIIILYYNYIIIIIIIIWKPEHNFKKNYQLKNTPTNFSILPRIIHIVTDDCKMLAMISHLKFTTTYYIYHLPYLLQT